MVIDLKQDLKAEILRHLPHGKASAITGEVLASLCGEGRKTRFVRRMIRELIKEGNLIGLSVKGANGGYFFIETPKELEECLITLRKYCVQAALHRRDLKRNGLVSLYKRYGQLSLV